MEVDKNDAPKTKKRMSGAARRMRSKLYKSGDKNNVAKTVNTDNRVARFINQVEKAKSQNPKEELAVVPLAASRKVKKDAKVQEAIKSQAFNIVRQKLVASLMQILPQSDGTNGGNWNNNNNNNNQGQMRSRNNNNNKNNNNNNNNNNNMNNGGWGNNNNNMNMNNGGFWSSSSNNNNNNNNNNINRGGSNLQGGWNNNTNNNLDRGVSNSQGGWNKNNRVASNSQGGWNNNNNGGRGVSNSSGIWSSNSNSNLNFDALNNMPNGWSNNQQRATNMNNNSNNSIWDAPCPEAPAPPPWNNTLSNSTLRNTGSLNQNQNAANLGGGSGGNWNGSNYQSTSMWGQNKWSDDPRNAGGREYFQGQQIGTGNDNYFNDQQNVDEYEQSSSELKFAIMDMNMPSGKIVGFKRQELLQSAFNKALAEVVLNSDRRFPPIQIKFSRFIQDIYKISVASRRCAEVLQNLVDRLPSLWPGSKLRLVAFQPRVKLQKASVFIRSGAIGRTNEEIFLIIERQNAGLATDKWHVFHKKEKDDGVLLILGIDMQSLDYLERNDGRVFFLTSNAIFRLGKKPVGATGPNGGTGNPNPKGGNGNPNPKGGTRNSNPNGGTGNPSTQVKKSRKRKRSKKSSGTMA